MQLQHAERRGGGGGGHREEEAKRVEWQSEPSPTQEQEASEFSPPFPSSKDTVTHSLSGPFTTPSAFIADSLCFVFGSIHTILLLEKQKQRR